MEQDPAPSDHRPPRCALCRARPPGRAGDRLTVGMADPHGRCRVAQPYGRRRVRVRRHGPLSDRAGLPDRRGRAAHGSGRAAAPPRGDPRVRRRREAVRRRRAGRRPAGARARLGVHDQGRDREEGHGARPVVGRVRGRRHRDHEHHAHERDRAHAGDRDSQVPGRDAARHPPSVPGRIRDALAGGRRARPRRRRGARRAGGSGHSAARAGDDVVGGARAGPGAHGRSAVRRVSRDPRGTARSHRRAAGRMRLHSFGEGWLIALEQLRANKARSGLTVLGAVIAIATVMAMASIASGFRQQIVQTLEGGGPTTFRVPRFFSQTPVNPDALPREIRQRPVLKPEEAEAIARLPEIHYAAIWTQLFHRFEYGGIRTQTLALFGADDRFMEILGGGIDRGRVFTPAERRTGGPVIIVEQRTVDRLFGPLDPVNRLIKVGGRPFRVIGVYQRPTNIFELPGAPEIAGIVPFETARRNFKFDEVNGLIILVRPVAGVGVPRAMDAVTLQLRRMRGIRVGQPNSFDMLTSDQVLSVFDGLTAAFFLVMLVLSSIALMVGGIGVMAIMMVSVTDRTREIGLRKAVGATRREILWQFLVEAATLTLVGGVIGIVFGLAAGELLKSLLRFSTTVPLWSAAVATLVSILVGVVFGIVPAARLRPSAMSEQRVDLLAIAAHRD